MTSSRPYLIRALHEWICDNQLTPYILVNAEHDGVNVPTQYVENGKIILNVNPIAVQELRLGNDVIAFRARFGGAAFDISMPPAAVMAVYSKENGEGMVFPDERSSKPPEPPKSGPENPGKPNLRIIK